jgi:hypothetical protein
MVGGTPSSKEEESEVEEPEFGAALADSLFACRLEAGATPEVEEGRALRSDSGRASPAPTRESACLD